MTTTSTSLHKNGSNNNIVGVHYKVGKKLGEGSFGVLYEGFYFQTSACY
jgi:casein kinase 1